MAPHYKYSNNEPTLGPALRVHPSGLLLRVGGTGQNHVGIFGTRIPVVAFKDQMVRNKNLCIRFVGPW
jgi:hypothetical protein